MSNRIFHFQQVKMIRSLGREIMTGAITLKDAPEEQTQ